MTETTPNPLGGVIAIVGDRIKNHLDQILLDLAPNGKNESVRLAACGMTIIDRASVSVGVQ